MSAFLLIQVMHKINVGQYIYCAQKPCQILKYLSTFEMWTAFYSGLCRFYYWINELAIRALQEIGSPCKSVQWWCTVVDIRECNLYRTLKIFWLHTWEGNNVYLGCWFQLETEESRNVSILATASVQHCVVKIDRVVKLFRKGYDISSGMDCSLQYIS